jgi:CubicO group peptidase (beta-lactamase class C family)
MIRKKAPAGGTRDHGLSPARLERLSGAMQGYVDRGEVAGVVTLLARRGQIAHVDVLGWQDAEARVPLRRDSLFRIASMTKPVTSVAALLLLEEGRLRLDDPIERWLPEFAQPRVLREPAAPLDDTRPALRAITVLDLLLHTPGFVSQFAAEGPIAAAVRGLHSANGLRLEGSDAADWLRRLAALPLCFEPGERVNYGFATDVLGLLVARAAGVSFGDFLQERLFMPLGMADTAFHVPPAKRDRLVVAWQAEPVTGKRIIEDHPRQTQWAAPPAIPSGSAGLVSTADDYLQFAQLLLDCGQRHGRRLLSRKTIELMRTNFLTPAQRQIPFFGTNFWAASGFGLGVAVLDDLAAGRSLGSVGSYGWAGAYGTWWSNDPVEELVSVMMIQLYMADSLSKIRQDFTTLSYQSIDD